MQVYDKVSDGLFLTEILLHLNLNYVKNWITLGSKERRVFFNDNQGLEILPLLLNTKVVIPSHLITWYEYCGPFLYSESLYTSSRVVVVVLFVHTHLQSPPRLKVSTFTFQSFCTTLIKKLLRQPLTFDLYPKSLVLDSIISSCLLTLKVYFGPKSSPWSLREFFDPFPCYRMLIIWIINFRFTKGDFSPCSESTAE